MSNLPTLAIWLTDVSILSDFWTSVTGEKMSARKFMEAGSRINTLERYMNTREGISRKDDTLPRRMLETPRPCDRKKYTVPVGDILDRYYKLSGYNHDGVPTSATLKKFGIL